jgi:hypothetical protein
MLHHIGISEDPYLSAFVTAIGVILVVLAIFGSLYVFTLGGSFLYRDTPEEIAFRRRPAENLCRVICSLLIFGGVSFFYSDNFSPAHRAKLAAEGNSAIFFLMGLMYSLPAIAVLWETGPQELILDLKHRTYRMTTTRLLFLRRIISGSCDEIDGVCIKRADRSGRKPHEYFVCIGLNHGRHRFKIGDFENEEKARQEADKVSRRLGLQHTELSFIRMQS